MDENDKKLLQLYKKDIRKKRIIVFLLILIFIGGCSLYYFYIDLKQSTKESNSDNKEITSNSIELKDTNEEMNINVTNESKTKKTDENKIRLFVYNTGEKIPEEYIKKIWGRFYKVDSSRNRNQGGTGIGLALVKAIMNNYNNKYGVRNFEDGVEFYCDLNKPKEN